ncbi:hypothetical protein B5V01_13675 [Mesorhizobium erdmanii]|uniref:Uncharacterized protein n=2 Tax=Mesorhizobium TaxID=68287 RepID=A0A3M9X128_9HYPH|nr:hypothetical protein DNR46_33510 [Mesorhizobium japonicum]RXT45872.1 hypothetical protein B5V01_13675 [Mesorhizobium erdmanii]
MGDKRLVAAGPTHSGIAGICHPQRHSSTHPSAATVLWDELDAGSASTAPGLDLLEKRWPGTNQGAEVRAGFLVGGVRAALGSAATKDSSTGRSGAMA